MTYLTDEEVLDLQFILVSDNEIIKGIEFEKGILGAGNSNTSGYRSLDNTSYTLDELSNRMVIKIYGVKLSAIVSDTMYLVNSNKEVLRIPFDKYYHYQRGVAYDTYECYHITPLLK